MRTKAALYNLDPFLVEAIVEVESSGNVFAMRFEPKFKWLFHPRVYAEKLNCSVETEIALQSTSWGYGQIMGATCRELGFNGWFGELLSDLSLEYSCKYLAKLRDRFGCDCPTLASAYNAGSPRKTSGGMFENQRYVDKVIGKMKEMEVLDLASPP